MAASSEYPCPQCHQGLLLDEDTAGRKVKCPYCKTQVQMPYQEAPIVTEKIQPRQMKGKGKRARQEARQQARQQNKTSPAPTSITPSLFGDAQEAPQEETESSADAVEAEILETEAVAELEPTPEPARQIFPLHNSRPLNEAPEGLEHHGALPPEKAKSSEDELRRLASMAGNLEYDLEKFEKKGQIAFGCPMCHRPMSVSKKDAGQPVHCEGCGLDILAPKPELGIPAQLMDKAQVDSGPTLPKARLPEARKVDDQSLSEGRSGGRTKRNTVEQSGLGAGASPLAPHKAAGTNLPLPKPELKIQPVPAKSDTVLGGQSVSLPSERISQARTVGKIKAEAPSAAPAPKPSPKPVPAAEAEDESKPKPRGAIRLNNERRVFAPQKDVEGDLEITEAWGQAEQKAPVSKRYVIIAWLIMIPILLGLGFWFMRETFRKKPEVQVTKAGSDKNEAHVVHVAESILKKFFEAKSVEEMAQYVRHPDETLPRMQTHYKRPLPTFKIESFSDAKIGNMEGRDFLTGVLVISGEKPKSIALEVPPEDSANPDDLKLDWESLVYWSEMPWDQFLASESEKGVDFRVVLQQEDYFNAPYNDQNRWVCFKLYDPASYGKDFGFCYGYMELDSNAFTAIIQPMRRANELGQRSLNAIVRLRFRPEARGLKRVPQVSIERFSAGWLIP